MERFQLNPDNEENPLELPGECEPKKQTMQGKNPDPDKVKPPTPPLPPQVRIIRPRKEDDLAAS